MRVGLLGCGNVSPQYAIGLGRFPGVELVACADLDGPRAEALAAQHGIAALSPDELMADIKSGLYITDLIGFGVNGVTGDYSRGASGFWIENGKRACPVSGITVAGNPKDMFLNLTPASDLQFKSSTNAPTVRIEGTTIAGS